MEIKDVPQSFPSIRVESVHLWKFNLDIFIFAWRKNHVFLESRGKNIQKAAAVIWSQAERFSA